MNINILNRPLRHAALPFDEPSPGDAKGVTGIGARVKERMWQRMARECEAMVQYAFSNGRVVPIEVMVRLDQAVSAGDGLSVVAAPDRRHDASTVDVLEPIFEADLPPEIYAYSAGRNAPARGFGL